MCVKTHMEDRKITGDYSFLRKIPYKIISANAE